MSVTVPKNIYIGGCDEGLNEGYNEGLMGDLQKRKGKLEDEIDDLLHAFETETGLTIDTIRWIESGKPTNGIDKLYGYCKVYAGV